MKPLWRKDKFDLVVLGPGRGGTSLVGSLLDAHPQLTLALEEHAADFLLGEKLGDRDGARQGLRQFVKACQGAAQQAPTPHWGNKITTEQLGMLEARGKDPEALRAKIYRQLLAPRRVVFVQRDGRSCVYSKFRRTGRSPELLRQYWRHSVSWLRALRARNHPQLHFLKFEDLLRQPEVELRALCSFLGLTYQPQMLEGTASNRILVDYRRPGLEAARAVLPPEALVYQAGLEEELLYLGYPLH